MTVAPLSTAPATAPTPGAASSSPPWWRRPGIGWIAFVVALLLGNVGMVTMLIVAAGPVSARRVLPDYYQRAANYDQQIAQNTANRTLGWDVKIAVKAGQWQVAVATPTGALRQGEVALAIRHRTKPQLDRALALRGDDGMYVGDLLMPSGIYDVELTVAHGGQRFVEQREVEVVP